MNAVTIPIRERLGQLLPHQRAGTIDNRAYQLLRQRIHAILLDRVDLENLQRLAPEQVREQLRLLVERLLEEEAVVIN
ncbi:MAG: CpaF family protein, partial [Janthinobacterium sp.]